MAVVSYREVLPRTMQHRIGESPNAERKYVVTVDGATDHQAVIAAVNIGHGDPHPEYAYLAMTDASLSEVDPYHVEITYRYELLKQEFEPNPLLRPDIWNFSTGGATVPAIAYYDAGDQLFPLVNAAGDFIENATTEEAELRASISGNRPSFPMDVAAYVTNAVNDSVYLGCPQYTWKCAGISAQQAIEVVNDVELRYYQITAELIYRASGWPLILPDCGFNFLDDGRRKRCYSLIKEGDQLLQIPTANAVALAANGQMLPEGLPPRLLVRRVHRAVPFGTYFGTPTF
jgi:hypothetical protein